MIRNYKGTAGTDGDKKKTWKSDLLSLAADWFWEQDATLRFTRLEGVDIEASGAAEVNTFLGMHRWEIGLQIDVAGGWEAHRAWLAEQKSFHDVTVWRELPDGKRRYAVISGMPFFDDTGKFAGYRGIGKTVSFQQGQADRSLFQNIIDSSPHPIAISDSHVMRLIYANKAFRENLGYSQEEILQIPLETLAQTSRAVFNQRYQQARAAGQQGITMSPLLLRSRDGKRRGWWEVHWQVLEHAGREFIVSTSRETSERKLADEAAQRTAWTLAALNATSEAMLQVATPEELYQRACDAAVEAGKLVGAAVFVHDPETGQVDIAAATGAHVDLLRQIGPSIDESVPQGRGLLGTAYRTGEPCTTDDFIHDKQTRLWREQARKAGVRAAAAIPLLRQQQVIAVLLLYSSNSRAFSPEIIGLLQRMAANICLALDSIEQETQRLAGLKNQVQHVL